MKKTALKHHFNALSPRVIFPLTALLLGCGSQEDNIEVTIPEKGIWILGQDIPGWFISPGVYESECLIQNIVPTLETQSRAVRFIVTDVSVEQKVDRYSGKCDELIYTYSKKGSFASAWKTESGFINFETEDNFYTDKSFHLNQKDMEFANQWQLCYKNDWQLGLNSFLDIDKETCDKHLLEVFPSETEDSLNELVTSSILYPIQLPFPDEASIWFLARESQGGIVVDNLSAASFVSDDDVFLKKL